jgi:hypothetical protein
MATRNKLNAKKAKGKKELKRTTTKKQRQEAKEAKKLEQIKTREERQAETQDIKDQFIEWGVDQRFEPVRQLYGVMDEYVETGEGSRGYIAWPHCPPQPQGRNIVFNFPRRRGNKCTCDLIVRDGSAYLDPSSPLGPLGAVTGRPQIGPSVSDTAQNAEYPETPIENNVEASETTANGHVVKSAEETQQLMPSVETIQAELDRVHLPQKPLSEN